MSGEKELPQLDDPLVRRMADRNHVPDEMWSIGNGLLSLRCDACHRPWPCETRRALQALGQQRGRRPSLMDEYFDPELLGDA